MPVNKNANIRYQALDRCFKNPGRHYSIDDLVEACNNVLRSYNGEEAEVRKRQVYDDIRFMKSEEGYTVPLVTYNIGRRAYYKYEDRNFSINNQPINEAEANQIKATLSVFQRFKGLPQFEWLQDVLPKMQETFGIGQTTETVFQFEHSPFIKGKQYIEPLYQHILKEDVLKITFRNFQDIDATDFILHPYLLKQYNKRWFLVSWNHVKQRIWVTALDRIEDIEIVKDKTFRPNLTDLEQYFSDVLGVTKYRAEPIQRILLKVYPTSIPYIKTKLLHHSQKEIEQTNEYLMIELHLRWNYELESSILSFGNNMEVIEPLDFRMKIAQRIEAASRLYSIS